MIQCNSADREAGGEITVHYGGAGSVKRPDINVASL